jgi:hypothetical protein
MKWISSPSIWVTKNRQAVQSRPHFAPVVLSCRVAREFLHRRELSTLRLLFDRFPVWQLDCAYALA